MGKLIEKLKESKYLVSDGAWGTAMIERGMKPGECPDLWSVEHFDDVVDIAGGYIDAGSMIVETNSFGANRCKLEHFGLSERCSEINECAAKASRKAAGDRIVMGSMGSTGKMLLMEEISEEEMYEVFKEQAVALEKGGADAVCIETMSDLEEACIAIKAVKENTELDIVCTFTFERTIQGSYRTMMGVSPEDAAHAAVEAGADVTGANCGNGMELMVEIIREMREAEPDVPLLVHANAGLPKHINGRDVYPETPEEMAGFVPALMEAGANIVGGCCGTTPAHIAAISKVISDLSAKN